MSKAGLGHVTENVSQYEGVVFYSMSDIPLVGPCTFVFNTL